MPELKTDEGLLKRLEQAAKAPLSAEQVEKQRISFIMGSMGDSSSVTRQQVTKILAAQSGRAAR